MLNQEFYAKNYQVRLESNALLFERMDYTSDGNGCCTSYPYRYKLQGTSMVREQPFGFDPNHFVASWGRSPWPEVEFTVDPSVRAKAKLFHDAHSDHLSRFGEKEYCDVRGLLWQVSVELESAEKITKYHFLLERKGPSSFVIKDFRPMPFENCRPSSSYPWLRTIFEKPLRW